MKKLQLSCSIVLATSLLSACGGSSSDGDSLISPNGTNSPAPEAKSAFTNENKENISRSAIQVLDVSSSLEGDNFLDLVDLGGANASSNGKQLNPIAQKSILSEECPSGGSIEINVPDGMDENSTSGSMDMIYDECVDEFNDSIDGSFSISWSGFDQSTGEPQTLDMLIDITTSSEGFEGGTETVSVDAQLSCDNYLESCSFTLNEVSYNDGENQFSLSDFNASSGSNGSDISATISVGDISNLEISGNDLLECENGNFESGSIDISEQDEAPAMTITFLNCSSYSLEFDGTTETYSQDS